MDFGCSSGGSFYESVRTLDFASIQTDHAGTTIPLLTVDRNFDTDFACYHGQLLSHYRTRDGFPIDRYLFVVIGTVLQSGVLLGSERVVILECIFEAPEHVTSSRRGRHHRSCCSSDRRHDDGERRGGRNSNHQKY